MSLDNGKPNQFRILADKPEGEILGPGVIATSDGQVHKAPAEGWPARGITYVGGWPEAMQLGVKVAAQYARRGLLTIEGSRTVVRPSRPDPDYDEHGSARVADAHLVPDTENPMGMPGPHAFPQADRMVFHDPDNGDQTYDVIRNPDKYVEGDKSGNKRVTRKAYDDGKTEVDWFYTLKLVSTGQVA